jgi:hypothetical protein
METTIKLNTRHHDSFNTEISIDNSTQFKDFSIDCNNKKIGIQLNTRDNILSICNVTLFGREIELLKEFLNQKK